MRFTLLYLFILNFQFVFGQLHCDDSQLPAQYGDYPPGCLMCNAALSGNNFGYTSDDTLNYDFHCGEVENSVWYSFYSRGGGFSAFRFSVGQCNLDNGIEAAIFDDNFEQISSCVFVEENGESVLLVDLLERRRYHILIDGIDGDECKFEVFASLTAGNGSASISSEPTNVNPCVGSEVCFSRQRDFALESYEWGINPTDSIVSGGINEEEICIYFKSSGWRDISLKVSTPCKENYYAKAFSVGVPHPFYVESVTSSSDLLCESEVVRFDADWDNDTIGLNWHLPPRFFTLLDGGGIDDNFAIARMITDGDATVWVTPDTYCGVRYNLDVTIEDNRTASVTGLVCNGNCFPLGDTCYFVAGFGTQLVSLGNLEERCDSMVNLTLTFADVFPSPVIRCEQMNGGLMINWERVSGADTYVVSANRDSIATVTDGSYFLGNPSFGSSLIIKVQPIGDCTYLPAEIDCSEFTTNTTSGFLENKISVYPNPTTGNLNIETDLQIEEINVFDVSGRFLQKEKTISFDLKNREKGIYFLKIKTNEGVGVKRVIIN